MSLWRYVFHFAPDSRQPSTIDAWSSLSISTRSPGPVQPGDDRDVRDVAGRVDARVLALRERRDARLEPLVQVGRAREQPHAAGAGAVRRRRRPCAAASMRGWPMSPR